MKHDFYTVTACGPVGGKYGFIVLFHPAPDAEPLTVGCSGTGNPEDGIDYMYPDARTAQQMGHLFATDKVAQEDGDRMVSVMFRTQTTPPHTTETEAVPADAVPEIPGHMPSLVAAEMVVEDQVTSILNDDATKGRRGPIRPLHETGMD